MHIVIIHVYIYEINNELFEHFYNNTNLIVILVRQFTLTLTLSFEIN